MKYPRSLLHGYDKATVKLIAKTLGIPIEQKKPKKAKRKHLKGVRRK